MRKVLNKMLPLTYGAYFNTTAVFSKQRAAEKAFKLFCTPRKGRVQPEQKEFLDQAKAERIKVKDIELQTYHWEGNRDTVLLLHGWESNTYRWRNLLSYLKKESFNTVAFDAPAHGYTSGNMFNVPLYTECTDAVVKKYRPTIIIGHSVGGMNALYHQQIYPSDHIEKIVTIGSPNKLQDLMIHYQKMLKFNNTVLSSIDDHLYRQFGFQMDEFTTSRFNGHLPKKGLVIHDELDTVTPFNASESVHGSWQNSTFFKTKGLGHSMHQEEVSQQIMAFIRS